MLELKPPPACSLACQVRYLTVPPFGKTQAGTHMTCEHPLAAHALHMLGSGVDFCARAERQTKCLVSVKKETLVFASNIHCKLALPSAFCTFDTVLPWMHALVLLATKEI